jgi:hypothetical protein
MVLVMVLAQARQRCQSKRGARRHPWRHKLYRFIGTDVASVLAQALGQAPRPSGSRTATHAGMPCGGRTVAALQLACLDCMGTCLGARVLHPAVQSLT